MKTSSRRRSDGIQSHYYKCQTTGDGHAFQTAAPVEAMVSEIVIGVLSRPDTVDQLAAGQPDESGELRQKAVLLRSRLDEAANSFASGEINAKQLALISRRVTTDLDAITDHLAALQNSTTLAGIRGTEAHVRAWWDAAGIEDRRAVIDALMTIYIDPVRKSAPRTFDPDRIRIDWKQS